MEVIGALDERRTGFAGDLLGRQDFVYRLVGSSGCEKGGYGESPEISCGTYEMVQDKFALIEYPGKL